MGIKSDLKNAQTKALKAGDSAEAERLGKLIDRLIKLRGDRAAGIGPGERGLFGPKAYTVGKGESPLSIGQRVFGFADLSLVKLIAEFNPKLFEVDPATGDFVFVGDPGDVLDLSFAAAPGLLKPDSRFLNAPFGDGGIGVGAEPAGLDRHEAERTGPSAGLGPAGQDRHLDPRVGPGSPTAATQQFKDLLAAGGDAANRIPATPDSYLPTPPGPTSRGVPTVGQAQDLAAAQASFTTPQLPTTPEHPSNFLDVEPSGFKPGTTAGAKGKTDEPATAPPGTTGIFGGLLPGVLEKLELEGIYIPTSDADAASLEALGAAGYLERAQAPDRETTFRGGKTYRGRGRQNYIRLKNGRLLGPGITPPGKRGPVKGRVGGGYVVRSINWRVTFPELT